MPPRVQTLPASAVVEEERGRADGSADHLDRVRALIDLTMRGRSFGRRANREERD
jgi:hypothetical protein